MSMKEIDGAMVRGQRLPCVLIVDDDSTARLALAASLDGSGRRIKFACNAVDAKQRMDGIDPDVVVCDLMMEEMRGDEFLRWMKSDPKWRLVPTIAVTQLDDPIVRAALLESGADSVLPKTAVVKELRWHVDAALRIRNLYIELRGESLAA